MNNNYIDPKETQEEAAPVASGQPSEAATESAEEGSTEG